MKKKRSKKVKHQDSVVHLVSDSEKVPPNQEVYREVNAHSFEKNFTILIQHFKKQIELNPPKIKIP